MLVPTRPLQKLQISQLQVLIERHVYIEEALIEGLGDGQHFVVAHHLGRSSCFHVFDAMTSYQLDMLNNDVWEELTAK